MYTTILVPLDGSEFSEHALPWAHAVALRTGGAMRLVHVLQPPPPGPAGVPTLDAQLEADGREYIWQHLESIAAALDPPPPSGCRCDVRLGEPATALRYAVRAHNADAIVMTTHGRGGMARAWLGSVADELIRTAGVPVLTVRPPSAKPAPAGPARLERILVALDGSPLSESVLPAVRPLAGGTVELVLVRVAPATPEPVYPPRRPDAEPAPADAESDAYPAAVAARLAGAGLCARVMNVTNDDPVEGLLGAAAAIDADVIALATHGRGGLRRALLGSVADRVVRRAGRPVLLHRPRG